MGKTGKYLSLSVIDTEFVITIGDGNIGFVDIGYSGPGWSGEEFIFELVHCVAVALGDDFDTAVGEITDGAAHLMARGDPEGEEAIADTLDHPGYDKSSCNHIADDSGLFRRRQPRSGTI